MFWSADIVLVCSAVCLVCSAVVTSNLAFNIYTSFECANDDDYQTGLKAKVI